MQLGVVDDIAVLAETDIKHKDKIAQRKSLYSQLQGQIQSMEESIQDKEGTIETLSRQLVQAGIKNKIMQDEVELDKAKHETRTGEDKQLMETKAQQKLFRDLMKHDMEKEKESDEKK